MQRLSSEIKLRVPTASEELYSCSDELAQVESE